MSISKAKDCYNYSTVSNIQMTDCVKICEQSFKNTWKQAVTKHDMQLESMLVN